ncbi:hypothetical protein ElyMa_002760300 [Elysia marginata]|uniref:BAR domain-containing protein n=1 Tax=Elysia marginata TaxID=1093978 RepID=A0AAV4HKW4_9GAST|nr:hypothetical protein ElyMa_002760300 [Elysia marginata]
MESKSYTKYCYATLSHPSIKEAIALHNFSILKLSVLVSEFAQQIAVAHEAFSKEIQAIIASFRRRNYELKKQRPVETPNCIFNTWEALLHETEMDAQAHLDAASLLLKNVYLPLQEVASHKNRQADMLASFRDNLASVYSEALRVEQKAEKEYHSSFQDFVGLAKDSGEKEAEAVRARLHRNHNDYILNIRATNKMADEFNKALPRILEVRFFLHLCFNVQSVGVLENKDKKRNSTKFDGNSFKQYPAKEILKIPLLLRIRSNGGGDDSDGDYDFDGDNDNDDDNVDGDDDEIR